MSRKTTGIILLWVGFLSGALATVWQAPRKGVEYSRSLRTPEQIQQIRAEQGTQAAEKYNEAKRFVPRDVSEIELRDDGWHLVNWVWYGVSLAVGFVGVVLIRMDRSRSTGKSEKTTANLAEIQAALNRLVLNTRQLHKESSGLPPSKILSRIDDDLGDDFATFAEGRNSITAELGLATFADVMSHFAAGERAANRAWSAAADGYVNESESCLQRAAEMLARAEEILNHPSGE